MDKQICAASLLTRDGSPLAPAFRYKPARWQLTARSSTCAKLCRRYTCRAAVDDIRHTAQRVKRYRHTVDIRLTYNTIIITSCTINTSKSVRIILHYRALPPPLLTLTEHMPYICPSALHLSYSVSTSSDREADKRPTGRAPRS